MKKYLFDVHTTGPQDIPVNVLMNDNATTHDATVPQAIPVAVPAIIKQTSAPPSEKVFKI